MEFEIDTEAVVLTF